MSRLTTSIVRDAHSYTRSKTSWLIDGGEAAREETTTRTRGGWRLFHYLSGGGMKAFGRSVAQEEADAKRTRFLIASAVVGLLWLYFWI